MLRLDMPAEVSFPLPTGQRSQRRTASHAASQPALPLPLQSCNPHLHTRSPLVRTARLAIDLVSRSVLLDGKPVSLTRKEYRLLHVLASHLGLVLTHDHLIHDIWGNSSPDNIQYLRMFVRRLRQKLEDDPNQPKLLISESGVGYRLERIAPTAASQIAS